MTTVALDQKPEVKAYSGFSKRNANDERIQQEEEELKQLLQDNGAQQAQQPAAAANEDANDANLDPEEKTFKKRYGDLRRHTQQKETQFQKQIDDLKAQLEKSTSNQIQLPKTEEELAHWAEQYPDVAKIVETIAMKKAKEQTLEFEKRFKSLDEREQQTAREKAEMELMKLHPDFTKIRDSEEFHDWVEEQPKWIQQALYENDTDHVAAARAIDLYKADKGLNKVKRSSSDREAAQSIGVRGSNSAPSNNTDEGVFYESQIAKNSDAWYEKNQEAIQKSIQSGKFVYDISGSAR
jgi:hypothetical protein